MKSINTTLLTISFIIVTSVTFTFACSEAEATNKMMALGRVQQAMVLQSKNDDTNKTITKTLHALSADMRHVSDEYLMQDKYSLACEAYDNIAQQYNIDLDRASEGMITAEQLQEDGGKQGGSCSLEEATIKMTTSVAEMQKLMEEGEIAMQELEAFNNEMEQYLPLMTTSPSEFCDAMDKLMAKQSKE